MRQPPQGGRINLSLIADGLTAPISQEEPADGTLEDEPVLDIRDRMVTLNQEYDDRGLLGLALHPGFDSNGRIFAYYSAPLRSGAPAGWDHTARLSEFRLSGSTGRADPASERVLMEIDEPQPNNNDGRIAFGPDGYLYVPTGDGEGADDVGMGHTPGTGNAQDMTKILGKILRIDVDRQGDGRPYAIPEGNPFLGNESIPPEIYASGLRNPAFMASESAGPSGNTGKVYKIVPANATAGQTG